MQAKKSSISQKSQTSTSVLTDLSTKQYNPVIGRDSETERVIEVLCRKDKSNPILVGDPGVGKTSVVYGLVDRIKKGNVPPKLCGKKILSLDISMLNNLQAIKSLFTELNDNNAILFIDEIHNIVGAGRQFGSLDLSNIMKPLLIGELTCIGATTFNEYQKYFEKDAALDRRFQKVIVDTPSDETALKMIKGLRSTYENFHGIKISDDAIEASIRLSKRYITDRQLPDKAIDLIDEAGSRLSIKLQEVHKVQEQIDQLMLSGEGDKAAKLHYEKLFNKRITLNAEDIAEVVSNKTGIPITKLNEDDKVRLLHIEDHLRARVIGQDKALKAIADSIITSRMGIKQKNSSFLFLGSTGVGKTETAKALAEFLFNDENALIRIDMSEYSEKHSISKLIGAPAGYVGYEEGGQLTEAVRRKPYSIVLFDEVEKAHPDVFNLFLQLLDDNRLTDNQGRTVSFSNTVIIMTSNLNPDKLNEFFRPEFLNRIDETITFNRLTQENILQITVKEIEKLKIKIYETHQINILVPDAFIEWLAKTGYNNEFGARPLKRLIHTQIEVPISKRLLEDSSLKKGSSILLKLT